MKHPDKDINKAIKHAVECGWTVKKSNAQAKPWGIMKCPLNSKCRTGNSCSVSIWSTPRDPQNHAKMIFKVVDGCTGISNEEENNDEDV